MRARRTGPTAGTRRPTGAVEAGPDAMPLDEPVRESRHDLTVAHPRKGDRITDNEHTTDATDAESLADLVPAGCLPEASLPTPEVLGVRAIA